jgi:hypothetical protein
MTRCIATAVVLIALLAGCADDSPQRTSSPSPDETAAAECEASLPFSPTSVPDGYSATPQHGVGGGAEGPPGETAFYFPSEAPGRFIDVFRGAGRYALSDPSEVAVLGGTGRMGAIEDGFGAAFELMSEPVGCRKFSFEAYGVSREELRDFVEGLRSTG